jgi:hypothetical protein
MFMNSMTWYTDPAAPCARPAVTFRSRVAQPGVPLPAAPGFPGEEPAPPAPEDGDADADGAAGVAVGDVAADELDDADDAEDADAAGAAADDDEDEAEDVHPAIKAPSVTTAIAASGVVVRRSVISAIPLSVTSRHASRPCIPSDTSPKTPPHRLWLARDYVSSATGMREP